MGAADAKERRWRRREEGEEGEEGQRRPERSGARRKSKKRISTGTNTVILENFGKISILSLRKISSSFNDVKPPGKATKKHISSGTNTVILENFGKIFF